MRPYAFTLAGACLFLFFCLPTHAQTSSKASSDDPKKAGEDKDPIAIVELGAATSWNLSGGAATFAPNLAAEVTPIENWLELEAGVSPFYTRKSTEWDTDLLFKKPWTISRKAEFMLGVGPEWVHIKQNRMWPIPLPENLRETSCSVRANTVSVGSSNRRMTTVLPGDISNPSA